MPSTRPSPEDPWLSDTPLTGCPPTDAGHDQRAAKPLKRGDERARAHLKNGRLGLRESELRRERRVSLTPAACRPSHDRQDARASSRSVGCASSVPKRARALLLRALHKRERDT
jgi:hypothetical protein